LTNKSIQVIFKHFKVSTFGTLDVDK